MRHRLPVFLVLAALLGHLPAHAASSLTPEQQAVHVLNRLAFGPKPGDIERVTQMGVQRYIESQLNPASLPYPAELSERLKGLETLNSSAGEMAGQFAELRKEVKNEEEGAKQRRRAGVAKITFEAADARVIRAIDSPRQLEEVMVDFWFNHFNVFSGKGVDRALITSYERDAIRPYVLGNFRDMLGATAKHPAMLYYLDNFLSVAPNYQPGGKARLAALRQPNAAKSKARGLNENYAREVMELHTLGVDNGYTQRDVTELARMLTGWTYTPRELVRDNQTFSFDPRRHDQGTKLWLGREVAPNGQREGEMALDVLALHPNTARHLSYKLAQYFVQDEPPPALVERMAKSYLDSKGDIKSVLRTLFASDEFMSPAALGAKFKTPYQFVISAARASATPVRNVAPLVGMMAQLGMPLYGCQTPDGYKNTQAAWLNPDALTRRITFATALADGKLQLANPPLNMTRPQLLRQELAGDGGKRAGKAEQPMAEMGAMNGADPASEPPKPRRAAAPLVDAIKLQATLGGAISPRTRQAVDGSPEPLRAAMLLGSPDFMQR